MLRKIIIQQLELFLALETFCQADLSNETLSALPFFV